MKNVSCDFEAWKRLAYAEDGSVLDIPVWFRVKGGSMLPLIHPGRDDVMIVPVKPEELKIGDIVLFPWNGIEADYCLHRIYKIDGDKLQTFGDGNLRPDGFIPRSSVLGKAVLIQRGKRGISCDDARALRLFRLWESLLPVRKLLLLPGRVLTKLRRILKIK